ncbi:MAG: alpha-1,2-fucosyltransferase [Bacteroidota bacterium]
MIVAQLLGGLGNQLFQYAAGYSLSYMLSTRLYLDIQKLEMSKKRDFALHVFPNINARVIKPKNFTVHDRVKCKYLNIFRKQKKLSHFSEPDYGYCPELFECNNDCYLTGYWQSYKYFSAIAQQLKESLRFPRIKHPHLLAIEKKMMATDNIVCVHIRRGDYVKNSHTNKVHGILPLSYYTRAIEIINNNTQNPSYYIFSDDPNWVHKQDIFKGMRIISDAENYDWEEMYLMTQCSHHIIANSSFSWWGAWLAENSDQIVIAPKQWFNDETFERADKIPEEWIRI